MAFSLELLVLPSEADELIKTAQREKRIFEHRKQTFVIRSESSAETAAEQQQELAGAEADLASLSAFIETLPAGTKKEDEITKRMALEVKIRKLKASAGKTGAIALIEQEYDADLLERQIAGINDFIAAVNARKAEL